MSDPMRQAGTDKGLPLRRESLAKDVILYIHNSIMSGDLKPGERIDQAAIAETLRVSKLPVREALIALESEGFIDVRPRRGAFVSALTREDILDHYITFGRIAALAAERAAVTMSEETLDELARLNELMRSEHDSAVLSELNERFHQLINRAASSNRLKHILRTFSEAMPNAFFEFAGGQDEVECTAAEHELIVACLKARDAAAAGAAMAKHFEARGRDARDALASRGFWDADESPEQ